LAYETIRTKREGAVLTITLDRPDRLNACPPKMADELSAALGQRADARAVLLKGEGRAFCSGADLSGRSGDGASSGEVSGGQRAYDSLLRSYNPMIQQLASLPVPVVSLVQGAAAGVGCSMALAADFVLAGKSGYFLQAFVNIGLVPDGGSSWILPRLVGLAQANRMMMLGERIYGEEAARIGLVYKCVEDDLLMEEGEALAERLAAGPTVAFSRMKQNIRRGLEADFGTTLAAEAEAQLVAGESEDAREGAIAFLQKRKASFSGR
jgi:2-(1,2-epoxy-1,2-dihydrophenyl)acetyl-CoA isomerase